MSSVIYLHFNQIQIKNQFLVNEFIYHIYLHPFDLYSHDGGSGRYRLTNQQRTMINELSDQLI